MDPKEGTEFQPLASSELISIKNIETRATETSGNAQVAAGTGNDEE